MTLGPAGDFLKRRSRSEVGLLALLGLIVIGLADYYSGSELSLSFFYLAPIGVAAWYGTTRQGSFAAVIGTLIWLTADLSSGHQYSHILFAVWNAALMLGFFGLTAFLLGEVKRRLVEEEQLADTDYLTGVYNRRAFYRLVEMESQRSRRYGHVFTLAYIDLDDFKSVNDAAGHETGDLLLRSVVGILRGNLRSSDTVARLGGDEFAVLLPETDYKASEDAVRKVRERLLGHLREQGWAVTFSMGVATFEFSPEGVDDTIRVADDLMYSVKKSGKGGMAHRLWRGARNG